MKKRIKFTCQSTKQLKFETYLLNLRRTYAPHHPDRRPGRCTASVPIGSTSAQPVVAAQSNHDGVQQPAIGPQLRVDTSIMSLVVPIDVLPLTLAN
jgi:hypothetical protein